MRRTSVPIIVILMILPLFLRGQTGGVSGRVFDAETGVPLPGANVFIEALNMGAATTLDGRYLLENIPAGSHTVRVSYVGYRTLNITLHVIADEIVAIDFPLNVDILGMEEVVVVGYGVQSRRNVSGAVTSIRTEDLNLAAQTSVNQMLQGRSPGLIMNARSAQPGGGVTVNIRGAISPRGSNAPLYVIDGVPITENASSVPGILDEDVGYFGGIDRDPLSYLNASDIESITILRDASAAAIYGSAAANGVILITTRSGRAGDMQVEYRGSYTLQTRQEYFPMLNARQFMEQQTRIAYDRYLYENNLPPYGTNNPANVAPFDPLFSQSEIEAAGRGTDWYDLIMRNGYIHEHNITVSGGTDRSRVFGTVNYQENQAILRNSSLSRYSGRINLDQSISNAMDLRLRMSVAQLVGNNASTGANAGGPEKYNMIQAASVYSPTLAVFDEEGHYTYTFNRLIQNPVSFLEITDDSRTNKLFLAPNLEIKFSQRLRANLTALVDREATERGFYLPRTVNNSQLTEGMAQKFQSRIDNYSVETYATYTRDFHTGELDVVVGAGVYQTSGEGFGVQAVGFFTDAFRYHNLSVAHDVERNRYSSWKSERTKLSQFIRLSYVHRDRYIFSLVGRRDGSSIFADNHRYGYFPGGSAAWIISEERFMQSIEHISELKLRVGYGIAGNESVLSGNTLQLYSPGYPFVIGNTRYDGIALSQVANPNLKWEKVHTLNVGIDFGLWRNRIRGAVDFFEKRAVDLLDFNPLPANNAVGLVADNVGSTRSRGFELSLNTFTITSQTFRWFTDLNLTHYEAHWVERNPRVPLPSYVGERDPLGAIYGWKTAGIIRSEDDIPDYMPNANLGNVIYVDINGDGILDSEDVVLLGTSQPRWTMGLNNTLIFGNFQVNVYVYGYFKFKRYNNYAPNIFNISQYTNPENTTIYARDIWTASHPTGSRPGVASNPYSQANPAGTDFDLEDASFIRLRDITLSYSIPHSWLRSIRSARAARVFVSIQNIGVLTNYSGFDPEYTEVNPYPKATFTTMGIELRF